MPTSCSEKTEPSLLTWVSRANPPYCGYCTPPLPTAKGGFQCNWLPGGSRIGQGGALGAHVQRTDTNQTTPWNLDATIVVSLAHTSVELQACRKAHHIYITALLEFLSLTLTACVKHYEGNCSDKFQEVDYLVRSLASPFQFQ